MNVRIRGELRMKGGRHDLSLPHDDRVWPFSTQDFDARACALNAGSAYKYHLYRGVKELPLANGTLQLTAIGIAPDVHINRAQAYLFGILNSFGKKDSSRAGAKCRLFGHELLELLKTFFPKKVQKCARFASGNNQAINVVELLRLFHQHHRRAQFFQPFAMRIKIAL